MGALTSLLVRERSFPRGLGPCLELSPLHQHNLQTHRPHVCAHCCTPHGLVQAWVPHVHALAHPGLKRRVFPGVLTTEGPEGWHAALQPATPHPPLANALSFPSRSSPERPSLRWHPRCEPPAPVQRGVGGRPLWSCAPRGNQIDHTALKRCLHCYWRSRGLSSWQ